eukprot:jgi/Chlat1/6798/Chrsp51S00506
MRAAAVGAFGRRLGPGRVVVLEGLAQKALFATAVGASTPSSGTGDRNVDIFDRLLKGRQRDRAAPLTRLDDPLQSEVTARVLDRLEVQAAVYHAVTVQTLTLVLQDITRKFPTVLNLGGAGAHVRQQLRNRAGVETLLHVDLSLAMLERSAQLTPADESLHCVNIVADEELLPIKERSVDCVVSVLGLHWVNDLPGAMTQCRRALKPDGLFLAAMLGGETLRELRIACAVAEQEREGGVSARVSPLAQVRDAGNLLVRAGLALPAVDTDTITVWYPNAISVVEHLRRMAEGNCVRTRRQVLSRDTALATAAAYQAMFGDENGYVPATYEVIYMAGWSPHDSQQKPKRRGSATVSMEDLQSMIERDSSSK